MKQFPFISKGLAIFALAENARRLGLKAENAELLVAAYVALADDLSTQGEEWKLEAANPTNKNDVGLIQEALGLYTNFMADASEIRRVGMWYEGKAKSLAEDADIYTGEADEANRMYLAEAKRAKKYARLAAEAAQQPAVIAEIATADENRQAAEKRRALSELARMRARQATARQQPAMAVL